MLGGRRSSAVFREAATWFGEVEGEAEHAPSPLQ